MPHLARERWSPWPAALWPELPSSLSWLSPPKKFLENPEVAEFRCSAFNAACAVFTSVVNPNKIDMYDKRPSCTFVICHASRRQLVPECVLEMYGRRPPHLPSAQPPRHSNRGLPRGWIVGGQLCFHHVPVHLQRKHGTNHGMRTPWACAPVPLRSPKAVALSILLE